MKIHNEIYKRNPFDNLTKNGSETKKIIKNFVDENNKNENNIEKIFGKYEILKGEFKIDIGNNFFSNLFKSNDEDIQMVINNKQVISYLDLDNMDKNNCLVLDENYYNSDANDLFITEKGYIIIDLSYKISDIYELDNGKYLYPNNSNLICGIILDHNFEPLLEGHTIFLRTIEEEKDGYSFICLNPNLLNNLYEPGFNIEDIAFLTEYHYNYRCKSDFNFK